MEKMKKILICVDVQEGFARSPQTREIANKIVNLTNKHYFDYIIATQFINKNRAFANIIKWNHLKNENEIKFVSGLRYDLVEKKHRYTCVDSKFIKILKTVNDEVIPTEVYICGMDTDCCVYKIAIDLFERGIRPIIISDYCQSNGGSKSHTAGLTVLKRNIGGEQIKVLSDIIKH